MKFEIIRFLIIASIAGLISYFFSLSALHSVGIVALIYIALFVNGMIIEVEDNEPDGWNNPTGIDKNKTQNKSVDSTPES